MLLHVSIFWSSVSNKSPSSHPQAKNKVALARLQGWNVKFELRHNSTTSFLDLSNPRNTIKAVKTRNFQTVSKFVKWTVCHMAPTWFRNHRNRDHWSNIVLPNINRKTSSSRCLMNLVYALSVSPNEFLDHMAHFRTCYYPRPLHALLPRSNPFSCSDALQSLASFSVVVSTLIPSFA